MATSYIYFKRTHRMMFLLFCNCNCNRFVTIQLTRLRQHVDLAICQFEKIKILFSNKAIAIGRVRVDLAISNSLILCKMSTEKTNENLRYFTALIVFLIHINIKKVKLINIRVHHHLTSNFPDKGSRRWILI